MTPEQWKRAEQLFHEASDLPESQRKGYLERECGSDPAVRQKVGSMLASDAQGGGSAVKQQVVRGMLDFHAAAPQPARVRRIGPYELVREIGRGGMGTVYLAERADNQYEGTVAIKVVRPGLDTEFFLARFRRERQTLARLSHPNIARLLDSGTSSDGLPYIVMEYIDGQLITDYCRGGKLGLADKIGLFLPVCAAVAHAHQNFVVHRDLKPGNILVDRAGNPKLLDFGVCKLLYRDTSATSATGAEIILTPDYGSPEQVRGEPVTVASDIYSLGAVLYELLTGEPVHRFEKLTPQHVEYVICETGIVPPSKAVKDRSLARRLEGDIDNVLMRALQKEPGRRYSSVAEFASDLRNHLEFRPVLARPDTLRYRLRKFVRRNHRPLIAALAVCAALTAGLVIAAREARIARRNFATARQLANAFVFDVHDQVKDLPGSLRARQTILGVALKYLDALSADARGDAGLQRELAAAYERIGEVQGGVLGSHAGNAEGSMSSYRKALELLEPLPPARDVALDRMLIYRRMGDLQFGTGKTPEAAQSYERGLAIGTSVPIDNAVRRSTADLHVAMGRLQRESQDMNASLASMSEGLRLFREARQAEPDVREIQASEAAALAGIGIAQSRLGQLKQAKKSFTECVRRWDELARLDPLNTHYRRQRMLAYSHLGNVLGNPNYGNLGDWKGARAAFDVMTGIAKTLHEADPADAGAWMDYGMALLHSAAVPDRSVSARIARLEEARHVLTDVSRANPANIVPKLNLAGIAHQIARIREESGDRAGAIAEYRSCYSIAGSLLESGRISAAQLFVTSSGKLAGYEASRGGSASALALAQEAVAAGKRAAGVSGASVAQSALLPRAYAITGAVYRSLGSQGEARDWHGRAAVAFRALRGKPGFTAQLQAELDAVEKALQESTK